MDLQEIFEIAAKKKLLLEKPLYYKTHLMIINGILPKSRQMTILQIEVLAAFMCLEGDISRHRFGTTGRKLVMEQLGLKPSALSNHLDKLKLKGALTETNIRNEYNILPLLMPNSEEQYYFFYIKNQGGQNAESNENKKTPIQQEEGANSS